MLEVTAAIICRDNKILICQRPADKNCGLLWEFPGGKIEPGETGEQCIVRECREELGVTVQVRKEVIDVVHEYPDRTVHLRFYLCDIVAGTLEKKEHAAVRWISREEIAHFEFCPADASMLSRVDPDSLGG